MDSEFQQDKIDRTERIIDMQIEGSRWVDDKSLEIARLTILLLGVLLTGVSLLIASNISINSNQYSAISSFAIAILFLHISIGFCMLVSFRSIVTYGPRPPVSQDINHLDGLHFAELLRTYTEDIEQNNEYLTKKVNRFRKSIVALGSGIIHVTLSVVLLVTDFNPIFKKSVIIFVFVVCIAFIYKIPEFSERII